MNKISPTGTLAALLQRYEQDGGAIEHVLIKHDRPDRPPVIRHGAAALFTLDVITRQTDAYFEALIRKPDYKDRRRDEFFRMTVNPDLLTGRVITVENFLGPWWDCRTKRLARTRQVVYGADMVGYAYAFFDPPYNLRCGDTEAAQLFCELTDVLFAGFPDSLIVYEWSTGCSNYFDAGREWWGTFFWTVEVPASDRLIGIAASTTD
jgi:hypothetical protein